MNSIVIFGASGDLTSRKLVPALYQLFRKGRLKQPLRIVGFSRSKFSHDQWRGILAESTAEFAGEDFDAQKWAAFTEQIYYHPSDIGHADDFTALGRFLDEIEAGEPCGRVYYLSTAPRFYQQAVKHLGGASLADESSATRRVVIEKPFGTDLASAQSLNQSVHEVFAEHQVYRIDHYLGKETVQNMMVLRFGNSIFEPIWNRRYIDHVQITVAEEVDVGSRAGYYDSAGVVRDMIQNHLLQLLMVTAMEAPVRYQADAIRNEKVKVLQAIRPLKAEQICQVTFRGQYRGYRDADGVDPTARRRRLQRCSFDRQLALAGRAVLSAQRQGDVVPHDADRHPVSRSAAQIFQRSPGRPGRGQPAGDPGTAGRGNPDSLSDQSARRRHEDAADRSRVSITSRNSAARCPRPTSDCSLTPWRATPACSPVPTK